MRRELRRRRDVIQSRHLRARDFDDWWGVTTPPRPTTRELLHEVADDWASPWFTFAWDGSHPVRQLGQPFVAWTSERGYR